MRSEEVCARCSRWIWSQLCGEWIGTGRTGLSGDQLGGKCSDLNKRWCWLGPEWKHWGERENVEHSKGSHVGINIWLWSYWLEQLDETAISWEKKDHCLVRERGNVWKSMSADAQPTTCRTRMQAECPGGLRHPDNVSSVRPCLCVCGHY